MLDNLPMLLCLGLIIAIAIAYGIMGGTVMVHQGKKHLNELERNTDDLKSLFGIRKRR